MIVSRNPAVVNGILVGAALAATIAGDAFIIPMVPVVFGAAPISAYWIAVAVALLAAGLARRMGQGRLLSAGSILAGLGLGLCAMAPGMPMLALIGRALTGLGVGVTMLAAQDALLTLEGTGRTAAATARYLAIYFGGMLAGTLVGGQLAARFGLTGTAVAGMALCFAAAALSWMVRLAAEPVVPAGTAKGKLQAAFPAFLLLAALPSRAVNGGLLYALPLTLASLGHQAPAIAAVATVYPAVMLLSPVAGRRLERYAPQAALIGQVVSAVSLVVVAAIAALPDHALELGVAASVVLGVGQILAMPSQTAVALTAARSLPRSTALGIYRAVERVGLAIGPAAAAGLAAGGGMPQAMVLLCLVSLVAVAGLVAVLSRFSSWNASVPAPSEA